MQKDKFGRFLTPGSYVIYGIRSGNSGGVRYGLILNSDIDPEKESYEQRVQVLGFNGWSNEVGSVSRPSTENMIKVADGTFPEEIEQLLFGAWSERIKEKDAKQKRATTRSAFPPSATHKTNR